MVKGKIRLSGKEHEVKIIAGKRYIDGMTVDEFMETLDPITLMELAEVGRQTLIDEKSGTKPQNYQKIMDGFYIRKSN